MNWMSLLKGAYAVAMGGLAVWAILIIRKNEISEREAELKGRKEASEARRQAWEDLYVDEKNRHTAELMRVKNEHMKETMALNAQIKSLEAQVDALNAQVKHYEDEIGRINFINGKLWDTKKGIVK